MSESTRLFLIGLRDIALQFVAAVEDYLGVPYHESGLYRRRKRQESK